MINWRWRPVKSPLGSLTYGLAFAAGVRDTMDRTQVSGEIVAPAFVQSVKSPYALTYCMCLPSPLVAVILCIEPRHRSQVSGDTVPPTFV